ncbi:MAG TPA: heme o synthase [Candidatus Saccharimonadales bacterium]|nr:heme o synthase [Candidatus Saccharimonadales bacterium]
MQLRAYYAALKPERTYANVMTTLAGFLFASRWHIDLALLIYTILGTTLLVMSACAANNCIDSRLDARMPSKRERATVTGVVSIRKLATVAAILGISGVLILIVHVNLLTALLGIIAYVDYVIFYTWSKRLTPHSTLIGTISGAIPLIAGYTAVTNRFDLTALLLGLVMVFWQMPHFFAIAIFRHDDYKGAGLPVWTVRYGVRNTQVWMLIYTAAYVLALVALALFGKHGWLLLELAILSGLYWTLLGVRGFRAQKPVKWAHQMFGFSFITLLVFSGAVALAPLLP